jgi:hypothetical protein
MTGLLSILSVKAKSYCINIPDEIDEEVITTIALNRDWSESINVSKSDYVRTLVARYLVQEYVTGKTSTLPVKFNSSKEPALLVVWPHEKDGDWLTRIDISL